MSEEQYQDINARVISEWVREGWEWGQPIDHQTYEDASRGTWQILLTPTIPVPKTWWPCIKGAEVLGLASGGGQQMPILTAAGAHCTVLDYAQAQLDRERLVAEREGYDIHIVHADMTRPLPFDDASFDVVINPVSLCYVREVEGIFREVSRVLRPGGVFLAGFDTGYNYVVDAAENCVIRGLPYDPVADPALLLEGDGVEEDGVQFSHTPGELIGGVCRAGLVIDDAYDDVNGEGRLSDLAIPLCLPYALTSPDKTPVEPCRAI